jgi:hypothetical protein
MSIYESGCSQNQPIEQSQGLIGSDLLPNAIAGEKLHIMFVGELRKSVTQRVDNHDDIDLVRWAKFSRGDDQAAEVIKLNIRGIAQNEIFCHLEGSGRKVGHPLDFLCRQPIKKAYQTRSASFRLKVICPEWRMAISRIAWFATDSIQTWV